jgi:hypothetical protein
MEAMAKHKATVRCYDTMRSPIASNSIREVLTYASSCCSLESFGW